jgi:hypothetical protein
MSDDNDLSGAPKRPEEMMMTMERPAEMTLSLRAVRPNIVQSYDCMTDPLHKSGPQPGFVIVLEQIPANAKFDKEAREQLLDIFRDASDYWGDRKVPFRCFYSFL